MTTRLRQEKPEKDQKGWIGWSKKKVKRIAAKMLGATATPATRPDIRSGMNSLIVRKAKWFGRECLVSA